MENKQSSSELRRLADIAEWTERQDARLKRQEIRLGELKAKRAAIDAAIAECERMTAAVKVDIAAGTPVKAPAAGGVVIGVPTATINVKGN